MSLFSSPLVASVGYDMSFSGSMESVLLLVVDAWGYKFLESFLFECVQSTSLTLPRFVDPDSRLGSPAPSSEQLSSQRFSI